MQTRESKPENHSPQKIQPKLEVGKEDDEYEKEANEVAGKVMRMSSGTGDESKPLMNTGKKEVKPMFNPTASKVGTMNTGKPVQLKMFAGKTGGMNAPPKVESGIQNSKGSGDSLKSDIAEEMGSKMGADFSGVKVHSDGRAADMNDQIQAKAFTHGNDIYFNQGEYNPSSNEGKHLLAHELTHTVQQNGDIQRKPKPKPQNVRDKMAKDGVRSALGDEFMTNSFSDLSKTQNIKNPRKRSKQMTKTVQGLEKAIGPEVFQDLGMDVTSYTDLKTDTDKAALAFEYGMIMARQEFIDKYTEHLVSDIDATPNEQFKTTVNNKTDPDEKRALVMEVIVGNPDLNTGAKEAMVRELLPGLDDAVYNEMVFGKDAQDATVQKIRDKAVLFYEAFGGQGEMPQVYLAAVGDKGTTTGLLSSEEGKAIGAGYFMYETSSFGNRLEISYPKVEQNENSKNNTQSELDISMNAYGFDGPSTVKATITMKSGDKTQVFSLTFSQNGVSVEGETDGIKIIPSGDSASALLKIPSQLSGGSVSIDIQNMSMQKTESNGLRGDEIQVMIASNYTINSSVGNLEKREYKTEKKKDNKIDQTTSESVEAKELFDSGSFIAKDVSTLQTSVQPGDKDLADKIIAFSQGLDVSAILAQLKLMDAGEHETFSQFELEGTGINKAAPIPPKILEKYPNPEYNDEQRLEKIQLLSKDELEAYYKTVPGFENLDYKGIIAKLKEFRSSLATSPAPGKVKISSTTDPQGTGTNPGVNNDFPDYYEHYIAGTVFGDNVKKQGLLKMDGNKISRENNDVLSALRSLSFLRLILEQRGLTQADFEKMDVAVFVGNTKVEANLGQVPTQTTVYDKERSEKDRKKLTDYGLNKFDIQVMAGKESGPLIAQKEAYEARGWTCEFQDAGDGVTRLVVKDFTDVDDAMNRVEIIRNSGHASAFFRTKTNNDKVVQLK